MGKLVMCGVSAYLFMSGLPWGAVCGGLIVLVVFWDNFSQMAGDIVEEQVSLRIRKRLRSDVHDAAPQPAELPPSAGDAKTIPDLTPDDVPSLPSLIPAGPLACPPLCDIPFPCVDALWSSSAEVQTLGPPFMYYPNELVHKAD